jgi:hypothetical protein
MPTVLPSHAAVRGSASLAFETPGLGLHRVTERLVIGLVIPGVGIVPGVLDSDGDVRIDGPVTTDGDDSWLRSWL